MFDTILNFTPSKFLLKMLPLKGQYRHDQQGMESQG